MSYRNPASNPTPLRIGDKGRRQERTWEVRARFTKGVKEEGQTYYWDEFMLQSDEGEVAWLSFDEGTWTWVAPFVPRYPLDAANALARGTGWSLNLDGTVAMVKANDTARIYFVEGGPEFQAAMGQESRYIDAGLGMKKYVIEFGADEIEFFRGNTLSNRDVLEVFGKADALRSLDTHEKRRRSQTIFGTVCAMWSLFALGMWAIAASGSSGRIVQTGSVPLATVDKEKGVRWGPFTLDPNRKVHRLQVSASLTQASAWVSGVMETGDEMELLGAQGDFWDESGSDSDGSWHESDLSASTDFVVTQPGPYYVRVYAEPEGPTGSSYSYGSTSTTSGTASFELREGVTTPRWLAWYGLLVLPLSLFFFARGASKAIAK